VRVWEAGRGRQSALGGAHLGYRKYRKRLNLSPDPNSRSYVGIVRAVLGRSRQAPSMASEQFLFCSCSRLRWFPKGRNSIYSFLQRILWLYSRTNGCGAI